MSYRMNRRLGLLAVPVFALVSACDNPVEGDDHLEAIASVEITDMENNPIAELHGDHWDFEGGGDALHLHVGEALEVRIYFVGEDGDRFQLPPSGEEYTLRVAVEEPTIAAYEGHDDHGHFEGLVEGETTAAIQVYHGSHADWASNPPLSIEVVDHAEH